MLTIFCRTVFVGIDVDGCDLLLSVESICFMLTVFANLTLNIYS